MQTRRILIMTISILMLLGCEQQFVSHTSTSLASEMVSAPDIPDCPIGMSIEDVSKVLKESLEAFAHRTNDRQILEQGERCILTHQFTTKQGEDRIVCMSGSILGRSTHYFTFANESLLEIVRRPIWPSTLEPPENPWERLDVVIVSPSLNHAALVEDVVEDFNRFERGMRDFEPNPALMLVPVIRRKPAVKEGHEIRQWTLGESPEQMDSVYGTPLRIAPRDGGKSARLYVASEKCGSYIAAIFIGGSLESLFSHEYFDPRFWLDQLGEQHSPPWNTFEILRNPPQRRW